MDAKILKNEIEEAVMSSAEALLQQLLQTDTELHGGHVHDFCRITANNLATGLAPRTFTDADLERAVAIVADIGYQIKLGATRKALEQVEAALKILVSVRS